MAPTDEGTGAERRQLADNVEGDIMKFSELDFARLGLATETDRRTTSAQYQSLLQNRFLPLQCPHYGESIDESSSNRGLFSGQLPNFADSTASNITPSPFMIDPSLSHEPCWQTPSFSPQPSSSQNHPSRSERRGAGETPTTSTPTGGPAGTFQYSPVAESRQPGLPRRRSRYFRSQQHQSTLPPPIGIPGSTSADDALDPMQRWRESPPETEPASLSAIADALKHNPLRSRSSAGSLNSHRAGSRAPSTISFGSGTSCSSASNASASSATFRRSNNRSRGRVAKRTRPTTIKGKEKDKDKRIFPCTFCCDSFKSKYDWTRHEKSLHLNLQGWRCAPFGGMVVSPNTGRAHCAYCGLLDPDAEHLDSHNHGTCENQGQTPTFSRKDHLVQHLRLVHHVELPPNIDSWKDEGPPVSSRCGFCSIRMQTWEERVDHLANHFRKGATMDNWKEEHCFVPSIAAKVTHAMPPYLIGSESRALIPFSVTNHGTKDQLSQIQQASEQSLGMWDDGRSAIPMSGSEPSPESPESTTQPGALDLLNEDTSSMTFPEVLALHLGRYAQEQMRLGIIPTDGMFQDEARRITFDSVDPWDQTIADNADWLSLFRDRHLKDTPGSREGST